jgi:hypothetical protein
MHKIFYPYHIFGSRIQAKVVSARGRHEMRAEAGTITDYNRSRGHPMSYVLVIWTVWAALGLVLLGLILYRIAITRHEEDQIFLEDTSTMQQQEQELIMKRVKPVENMIRIFGGAEGLVTLGILAFYLMDALRQF